jgi:hypothetical protein
VPTVFRVQNDKGEGPYNTSSATRKIPKLPFYPECHPLPEEDFEVFRNQNIYDDHMAFRELVEPYRFGFPNRYVAEQWFDSYQMCLLERHGFRLVEVPATQVVVSDSGRQCIFLPA